MTYRRCFSCGIDALHSPCPPTHFVNPGQPTATYIKSPVGLRGGVTVKTTLAGSCKPVQRAQKWVRCAVRWKGKAESGGSRRPRARWECVSREGNGDDSCRGGCNKMHPGGLQLSVTSRYLCQLYGQLRLQSVVLIQDVNSAPPTCNPSLQRLAPPTSPTPRPSS